MALFINQDDKRSELQSRLAAELREKAKQRSDLMDRPDGIIDSQYIKDTKTTTSLAWVWILTIIVFAAIFVWLILLNISNK